jgi:hypothetical protein
MRIKDKILKSRKQRGIALYMAVTVTGVLVLVSFAILNVTIRQLSITSAARDSQAAFFAADSGIECALFWDLKNNIGGVPSGISAFSTSSHAATVDCNGMTVPSLLTMPGGQNGTSTFSFDFPPDHFCVTVQVGKAYQGNIPVTHIESRGYNSCDPDNLRKVERGIKVDY